MRGQSRLHVALHELGLSPRQTEIYLKLLEAGIPLSASDAAERAAINKTSAYRILNRLEELGLVRTHPGRPTLFQARPLEEAIGALISFNLERITSAAEEILNQGLRKSLWHVDALSRLGVDVLIVRGEKAARLLLLNLIRSARRELLILEGPISRRAFRSVEEELARARGRGIEIRRRKIYRSINFPGGASSDSGWTLLMLPSLDGGVITIASSVGPTSESLKMAFVSLAGVDTFIRQRGDFREIPDVDRLRGRQGRQEA